MMTFRNALKIFMMFLIFTAYTQEQSSEQQSGPETLNNPLSELIAPGAEVVQLATGFKFTEGPAVDAEGNIFFTDQPNNRIHKWSIDGQISLFHESPQRANGLYFASDGKLLACADLHSRLIAIDKSGTIEVLVDHYQQKRLNGPNDLWPDPKGGIYFTDPYYQRNYWERTTSEQDGEHVYYLTPDRQQLLRVADDLVQPNGIIGTPDGTKLYVADIRAGKTYAFQIHQDGTLRNKQLFAPEGSDGMTIDKNGNVYLTNKAVSVFDSRGNKIGEIQVPERPSNVCFGGKNRTTLFITARTSLYAIEMQVPGI